MKFDISRVYTAVNASELNTGDKVIVACTLKDLMDDVKANDTSRLVYIYCIGEEDEERRFYEFEDKTLFLPKPWPLAYLVEHAPKRKYRPYKDCDEMINDFKRRYGNAMNANNPMWHPLIWVKHKSSANVFLCTYFNGVSITASNVNLNLKSLFDEFTYMDGSPCGVEE